jgi:Na+-driven multidrug efflux pump
LSRPRKRIFSTDVQVISSGVSALHALSFRVPFWAVWLVSSGSLRGSSDTRTRLIVGASMVWLSVLLTWVGVRWFCAGIGWVRTGFVPTSAPASFLVLRIFRQRIGEYERGHREIPLATAALRH